MARISRKPAVRKQGPARARRLLVMVATRKGAWLYQSDATRKSWRVDGPQGAARVLNMHPSTLRSRMQKLGIRRSAAELS